MDSVLNNKMSNKLGRAIDSHFVKPKKSDSQRNYPKPWRQISKRKGKTSSVNSANCQKSQKAHKIPKTQKDKIKRTCETVLK